MSKKKIIRATTVPLSLDIFCRGMLRDLSKDYEVIGVCSDGPEFNDILNREGVRMIKVPMERHISLTKDLKSLMALVKVFREEKPDMVHSMTPKAGLLCMIAAWLTRVPVRVHTFTGLVWPTSTGLTRQILKMTDRITCFCSTHVIPEGQGVLEDLRNGHITSKPMKVLGYGNVRGIDLGYWRSSKSEKIKGSKDSAFTFLFVGRIVGDKGLNELVSAFARLVRDNLDKSLRLILVGFDERSLDPLSEENYQLIDSMPEIESVGTKFGQDLLDCYEQSDCFVFPSYREGFPNTVLEAGAMELPCIVTDINGSREIITGRLDSSIPEIRGERLKAGEKIQIRSNGVVIPSKDEYALYDAMDWMLSNKEQREQMAANARPLVSSRFEQSFVRQQLYDYYQEVLK